MGAYMFRCWDTRAEILMFFGSGFMPYLDCLGGGWRPWARDRWRWQGWSGHCHMDTLPWVASDGFSGTLRHIFVALVVKHVSLSSLVGQLVILVF